VRNQSEEERRHGAIDRRALLYAAGTAMLAPQMLAPHAAHAQRAEKAGSVEDVKGEAFVVDRNERRTLAQAAPVFIKHRVGALRGIAS
jgi:hypothetical protein